MKKIIVAGAKSRTEEVGHIRIVLKHGYNEAFITHLRDVALEYLPPAVIAKVPPPYFSDEARAAYAAIGKSLEWNLTIDGDIGATGDYAFFFAARDAGLTPSQQSAATLLYATLEALEKKALSDRVQQNILDAYAWLDVDAVKKAGRFLPKRKKGSLSTVTKYIHKLAIDNPETKAICLFLDADKKIIEDMAEGTFANHVSNARNLKL